jgi:hypothetical protein
LTRVYLSHPYSSDPAANIARAKRWYAWVLREHPTVCPGAGWILMAEVAPETPYETAMQRCYTEIRWCQAVWLVGGAMSPGMHFERAFASGLGIEVVDLLAWGAEPPRVWG